MMVININDSGKVVFLNPELGMGELSAKNIILTDGAKEKGKNALNMPGDRCADVLTLGTARNILNIDGVVPRKNIVIYGTENLHLILEYLKKYNLNITAIVCESPNDEAFKIANNIYEKYHITSILGFDIVNSIKISNLSRT